MIKKIISLVFIILSLTCYAADIDPNADNVLNLKGYKIERTATPSIVITDALSESLATIETEVYDSIDLTPHLDELLGSITSGASVFAEQVIFSYRVSGTSPDSYSVKIDFEPLKQEEGEAVIDAAYQLGNLSYQFLDSYSDHTENGDTISADSSKANTLKTIVSDSKNGNLVSNWSVVSPSTIKPVWIHRGAVAMTISNSDFNSDETPTGNYSAVVTVTLTPTGGV